MRSNDYRTAPAPEPAEAVLRFWFGDDSRPRAEWFRKRSDFDALITARFGPPVDTALALAAAFGDTAPAAVECKAAEGADGRFATAPDVAAAPASDASRDGASATAGGPSQLDGAALQAILAKSAFAAWCASLRGTVALIVLCDQFTRNIHRSTPAAFGADALALALARSVVDAGDDRTLPPLWRAFVHMPFEHSESIADQARSVALFEALVADVQRSGPQQEAGAAPDAAAETAMQRVGAGASAGGESDAILPALASMLDYARRHRDVVARFGRFPHRNAVLGRGTTLAETQFLSEPGSSF